MNKLAVLKAPSSPRSAQLTDESSQLGVGSRAVLCVPRGRGEACSESALEKNSPLQQMQALRWCSRMNANPRPRNEGPASWDIFTAAPPMSCNSTNSWTHTGDSVA